MKKSSGKKKKMKMNKFLLVLIISICSTTLLFSAPTIGKNQGNTAQNSILTNYLYAGINIDNITAESVEADTAANNRISNLYGSQGIYKVTLELESYDSEIELLVYNILGKKVLEIYRGTAKPKDYEYAFDSNSLPEGVYICVLLGKDFRSSRKFIISR